MISNTFSLFILMSSTIALSYWLADRSLLARRFGVVMLVITFGLLLGNLGVVPHQGSVYDPVMGHIIALSIALLLFRLDFRELRKVRGRLLLHYTIGAVGTIVGAVIAWKLFGHRIGPDASHLAGQLAASYVGGGENAVAVAEAVGLRQSNPNLFSAAFAADNIVTAMWMMVALSAPFGFTRYFSNEITQAQLEAAKEHTKPFTASIFLPSCFYSLALAGLVVIASRYLAIPIKAYAVDQQLHWLEFNTSIIWITVFALAIAQTSIRKHLQLSYSLGMLLFLYFFFSMGAVSSIHEIIKLGPAVFAFVLTIVGVHVVFVLAAGKLLKSDMATVFIASQCNIGGPATAVALAEANGWQHMIVPSILLGVLGYAVANYIGIILAQIILPML